MAFLRAVIAEWNASKGASKAQLLDAMAEDVDFRSLAEGRDALAFTARRSGRAEAAEYLDGLTEAFEMIHYTIDEYVAQGDRVVMIGSTAWRNRRHGRAFETPVVAVVAVREGRIASFLEFYDTAVVAAAAG